MDSSLSQTTSSLQDHLAMMTHLQKFNGADMPKTMPFLSLKLKLLRAYCAHVAYFIQLKSSSGVSEPNDHQRNDGILRQVIDRLIHYRLLMERIKPLELKSQLSIDKLIREAGEAELEAKAVASGSVQVLERSDDNDNLMMGEDMEEMMMRYAKPNPENLVLDSENEENEMKPGSKEIYRPKKERRMVYPGDKKHKDSDDEVDLMSDLNDDEQSHKKKKLLDKELKKLQEKRQYEEANMMRFGETKADKRATRLAAKPFDELDQLDKLVSTVTKRLCKKNSSNQEDFAEDGFHANKRDEPSESMSEIEDDMQSTRRPFKKPSEKKKLLGKRRSGTRIN